MQKEYKQELESKYADSFLYIYIYIYVMLCIYVSTYMLCNVINVYVSSSKVIMASPVFLYLFKKRV